LVNQFDYLYVAKTYFELQQLDEQVELLHPKPDLSFCNLSRLSLISAVSEAAGPAAQLATVVMLSQTGGTLVVVGKNTHVNMFTWQLEQGRMHTTKTLAANC
jgi:hypothetical protein